jgi:CrcB protein
VGAVPGALLRWALQADPLANLLGALLLGMVSGLEPAKPRLLLLLGIGFCGSLTTFSGWILALASAIHQRSGAIILALLLELAGGIVVFWLGRLLAARSKAWHHHR